MRLVFRVHGHVTTLDRQRVDQPILLQGGFIDGDNRGKGGCGDKREPYGMLCCRVGASDHCEETLTVVLDNLLCKDRIVAQLAAAIFPRYIFCSQYADNPRGLSHGREVHRGDSRMGPFAQSKSHVKCAGRKRDVVDKLCSTRHEVAHGVRPAANRVHVGWTNRRFVSVSPFMSRASLVSRFWATRRRYRADPRTSVIGSIAALSVWASCCMTCSVGG